MTDTGALASTRLLSQYIRIYENIQNLKMKHLKNEKSNCWTFESLLSNFQKVELLFCWVRIKGGYLCCLSDRGDEVSMCHLKENIGGHRGPELVLKLS